jgi:beta-phosphoglucomutase-like phosphatase (HAD superfamily)
MDAIQTRLQTCADDAAALLFDLDGTLVESHELNFMALRDAMRRQGHALGRSEYDGVSGLRTVEQGLAIGARTGIGFDTERLRRDRDGYALAHLDLVEPRPDVVAIARASAGRVPLALVTGSTRATALPVIEALGLESLFSVVVTGDDVVDGKPAPDGYLTALEALGVSARAAVAYEDSDEGLTAARAAGICAIDVRLGAAA